MKTHYLISLEGRSFTDKRSAEVLLDHALWLLSGSGHVVKTQSAWHSSSTTIVSVDVSDNADEKVVTGAIVLESHAAPAELLKDFRAVEIAIGRKQKRADAVSDVSLLLLGRVADTDDPAPAADVPDISDPIVMPLPHLERMPSLLLPLREIAPDWVHPDIGESITEMCAALEASGRHRQRSA